MILAAGQSRGDTHWQSAGSIDLATSQRRSVIQWWLAGGIYFAIDNGSPDSQIAPVDGETLENVPAGQLLRDVQSAVAGGRFIFPRDQVGTDDHGRSVAGEPNLPPATNNPSTHCDPAGGNSTSSANGAPIPTTKARSMTLGGF